MKSNVTDTAKFVVLLPQIGFDDFCCRQESENGRVSLRKTATLIIIIILRIRRGGSRKQSAVDGSHSDGE